MYTTIAVILGVLLDFLIGDPQGWFHPIRLIGNLISGTEKMLRKKGTKNPHIEFFQGILLWIVVTGASVLVSAALLIAAYSIHPWLYVAAASVMSYQIMATKSLRDESMKVYDALKREDLPGARYAVSMIVGRDTDCLDEQGVAKAAVETVAENTSDGCIAPLVCLMLGGPVLGFFYKAVNTMDSMVGYKNEKYLYFGRFAAKMDDICNFLPSRLSALLMILASGLGGFDPRQAAKIYRRDRLKSPSPNSAQTEAVCAGALQVELLGDTSYFGVVHHKEVIGDPIRQVEIEDIKRANRLLYRTVLLAFGVMLALRIMVLYLWI